MRKIYNCRQHAVNQWKHPVAEKARVALHDIGNVLSVMHAARYIETTKKAQRSKRASLVNVKEEASE